jgi:hypothetical protein
MKRKVGWSRKEFMKGRGWVCLVNLDDPKEVYEWSIFYKRYPHTRNVMFEMYIPSIDSRRS